MNWNKALTGGLIVGGLLVLTGCPATKQDAPEPTSDNIINGTNTQVIRMPDGFRNVAVTCDKTTAIYVTSRGWSQESGGDVVSLPSTVAVVPNSKRCGGTQ